MVLFSLTDIKEAEITINVTQKEDYVKMLIDKVPIGKLKVESIKERDDTVDKVYSKIPRYSITGEGISYRFYTNKFIIDMGQGPIPEELKDVIKIKELDESFLSKDNLNKVSIDSNYLLGIISSITKMNSSEMQISGRIRGKKNNGNISYNKIINNEILKNIGDDSKILGMVIENKTNNWKIYVRDGEDELNVTIWFDKKLEGPLDIHELLENHITNLNTVLLSL